MNRRDLLAQLRRQHFDLLIIGGGIVGAGIARDAAIRGLKVALIEQDDFAGGTSSKTSKLIHGGLRYLAHGHVRLVMESLRERHILRTIAPALVHPRSMLLPVYQDAARSAWQIHLGLWLYDLLALRRNIRPHRMLSALGALALEPHLRADGLRTAGLYADCQMDDARLCLANILQAVGFGAVCCNYVRLRAFLKSRQHLVGGVGEDLFTGLTMEIQARVVINATGPWSDALRRTSEQAATPRLAPTKGIHLIVPPLTHEALFVEARRDRRMFFLLPWGEYSLIGTTETPVSGALEALSATADEVDYLLEETNRVIPGRGLKAEEIIATYAGARPLLSSANPSTNASREHRIEIDRWGLVSVMGGKYTTYRLMAQQVLDLVMRRYGWRADRCLTDQVSLLETTQPIMAERWRAVTRDLDPDLLTRLITRYGAGTFHVLALVEGTPSLAQPVCPHHELILAELAYALQHELACTITDVLARRTRIAFSPCQGLDLLSSLSVLIAQQTPMPIPSLAHQIEAYHQFLARSLAFRTSDGAAISAGTHDGT